MATASPKRILVVEDEKAYSRALVLKLSKSGFLAESAGNGEEALQLLRQQSFDLVLCDVVMPRMNGFQFLEEMRKQGLSAPVIGLSNLSQPDDEQKMRDLGAADFIAKSNTSIIEVISKVKGFLGN